MVSKLNIYDHLTPDTAAHCQKIGHVFSPLDMAVIVAYSKKTVKEKLAAWQSIIDECPDTPIRPNDAEKSDWWQGLKKDHPDIDSNPDPLQPCATFRAKESLHEYLRGYIAWHEKAIADFYSHGEGIIFRPDAYWTHHDKYHDSKREEDYDVGCYSTLEKALSAAQNEYPKSEWPESELRKIVIHKGKIDSEFSDDESALFDPKGELLQIYYFRGMPEEDLDDIFIHLPVPFEKGDIVTDDDGRPCVLVGLPIWNGDYEEYTSGRFGDATDQVGLAFGAESFFEDSSAHEHPCTLHLEYYKKELQGCDMFLNALSQYVKTKDKDNAGSPAVHLIAAFRKFQAEAEAEKLSNIWDEWFQQPSPEKDSEAAQEPMVNK
jgi:hypothetical protein